MMKWLTSLLLWSFALSCAMQVYATDAIYKCTSATGAVSYSQKPCPSNAQVKKIEPREVVISHEPVLPGNIPGRKGLVSPEPAPETGPKHTPKPDVKESCKRELFNLKRDLDSRFISAEQTIKAETAALKQNSQDLGQAQSSKVGAAWSITLAEQRQGIENRLRDAQTALQNLYVEEQTTYQEIAKRCKKN
jgi:Domain of unknown function (DUF4124)